MFFDRENEPDLGDGIFGNRIDDHHDTFYEMYPSSTSVHRRAYRIPLWMYSKTKEELVAYFAEKYAEKQQKLLNEKRAAEIAELEEKLRKLKENL